MRTLEHKGKEYVVVEVPNNAFDFQIDASLGLLFSVTPKASWLVNDIELPDGNYEIETSPTIRTSLQLKENEVLIEKVK